MKSVLSVILFSMLLTTLMSMDNLALFTNSLKVKLHSFDVNMTGDSGVVLTWSTLGNDKHAKFVVEKSLDGFVFLAIGEVLGLGDGSQQYFQEDHFFEWKAYYRLKQVAQDGAIKYSNTVFIENTNYNYRFYLYPNPIRNDQTLHLQFNALNNPVAFVLIYDHIGKLYMKIEGHDIDQMKIDKLPTGFYILAVVSMNGHREAKRFQVVE